MSKASRLQRKGDYGFTLLELMFVIAIIAILATYGVPKYNAVKEQSRLESAAQKTVSQLEYGKQMAMDKRKNIYIIFQSDRVGVYRENAGSYELTGPALFYEGGISFSPADNTWLDERYENITSGPLLGRGLGYNYRGFLIEDEDHGIIVLKSAEGQSVNINISRYTGKIDIQ